jgi:hypothetical protein
MNSPTISSSLADAAEADAKGYRPSPIDTSGVQMPREVKYLTEKLARNVHENWAEQRLADGWHWERSAMTHANFIPAWCLTTGCLNRKRLMIALRLCKP